MKALTALGLMAGFACGQEFRAQIPKTWDDEAVRSMELPLASLGKPATYMSAAEYYKLPIRQIPKGYPVYYPGKEPAGYMKWLTEQEPQVAFDASLLRTEADWIKAGEAVFYEPRTNGIVPTMEDLRNPDWYQALAIPVASDGRVPFFAYTIAAKGKVLAARTNCAQCHVRVLADGTVVTGAQGNSPVNAMNAERFGRMTGDAQLRALDQNPLIGFPGHTMPWLNPDPAEEARRIPARERIAFLATIPPGITPRIDTSLLFPPKTPDLIGLRDRKYFDATGVVRHRGAGDLMRYAALVGGMSNFAVFDGFRPFGDRPYSVLVTEGPVSDDALYALSLYLYSLKPPPNPNRESDITRRGQRIFDRETCAGCHTPPLYTNNKLTPALGFKIPEEHKRTLDILPVYVGTDPRLALQTRKGSGYYKVPSLKGVWYRGPFEHNGSVATLEDWFDPARLRNVYVPTGFKGYGVKTRAVKGHKFGLKLNAEDKRALIAFLQTL